MLNKKQSVQAVLVKDNQPASCLAIILLLFIAYVIFGSDVSQPLYILLIQFRHLIDICQMQKLTTCVITEAKLDFSLIFISGSADI